MKTSLAIAFASCPILAACSGSLGADPDPSRAPASPAKQTATRRTELPTEAPPPPVSQALGVVAEGRCGELSVSFVGDETFVHHGHVSSVYEQASTFVLARVTASGIEDGPELTRGIRRGSEPWRAFHLMSFEGSWPNDAKLTMWSEGGERVGTELMEYAWKGDRWQLKDHRPPAPDEYGVSQKWENGSTLWVHPYGAYPEFVVLPRGKAKTPDFGSLRVRDTPESCMFDYGAMLVRESGEVYLAGRYCGIFPTHASPLGEAGRGEAALARWAPGGRATLEPIPSVAKHAALRLTGLREAGGKIYAFGAIVKADETSEESYVARSDGAGWTRIAAPFKDAKRYELEDDGTLWAWADGAIYRRGAAAEGWEKAALEGVKDVAWKDKRPVWSMTDTDLFQRGDEGSWAKVDVPKPAFSEGAAFRLDGLSLSPSGELWAKASYAEKRAHWTQPEERQALLHYGAPRPAGRCDAGGSGDKSFFAGWPETATETCSTPFALLVRVSKSAPATYDYPQTRAALKGHKELEGAEFVDIELEGRRYFGAKATSIAQGRAAVEAVGKKVQGTRPELVCLAPKVTRTLALDLATGTVKH